MEFTTVEQEAQLAQLAIKTGADVIRNHHWIGGTRDFEISRSVFRRYLQRVLPGATLAQARTLYENWKRSPQGPFNASVSVEHLGVSEVEASYYLEVVSSRT